MASEISNNKLLNDFVRKKFERNTSKASSSSAPPEWDRVSIDVEDTLLYNRLMRIARAPFCHPYNPTGNSDKVYMPYGVINVKLINAVFDFLPDIIQQTIKQHNIARENIDFFFIAQNMPWENENILIRPHYWLHGEKSQDEGIIKNTLNIDTNCHVGIFPANNPEISLNYNSPNSNHKNILCSEQLKFSSHPSTDANNKQPMIIVSPDAIGVLKGIKSDETNCFFTLIQNMGIQGSQPQRSAVTLHWLLSNEDYAMLLDNLRTLNNLDELIRYISSMENSKLNVENGPLFHLKKMLNWNLKDHLDNKQVKSPTNTASAKVPQTQKTPANAAAQSASGCNIEFGGESYNADDVKRQNELLNQYTQIKKAKSNTGSPADPAQNSAVFQPKTETMSKSTSNSTSQPKTDPAHKPAISHKSNSDELSLGLVDNDTIKQQEAILHNIKQKSLTDSLKKRIEKLNKNIADIPDNVIKSIFEKDVKSIDIHLRRINRIEENLKDNLLQLNLVPDAFEIAELRKMIDCDGRIISSITECIKKIELKFLSLTTDNTKTNPLRL